MAPETLQQLERLAAARIEIVPTPEITTHFVLARDGFAALVERRSDRFGSIGAPGRLTTKGLEVLVWRGEQAYFVARGHEEAASSHDVQQLRAFSNDLRNALGS